MPRIARKYLETSFFHVVVQGISKEYIFKTEEDIATYLYLIKKYCENYNVTIIAYCMMNNHAHFLLNIEKIIELSKVMQRTNVTYGKYYNKTRNRVGYVFRDRFVSEPIMTEIQLLNCIAYIHNNPVKAKMVTESKEYKYSSYTDYIKEEGIATRNTIKIVFGMMRDYKEQFIEIHRYADEIFADAFMQADDKHEEIINDYLKVNNISIDDVTKNEEKLKQFLLKIRDQYGVSNRKLSKILNIGREKLRKM